MKRWVRHAEVQQVTKRSGWKVDVLANFLDGGVGGQSHETRAITFSTSRFNQPSVGTKLYIAIGELPEDKSPVEKILEDAIEESPERPAGEMPDHGALG